MSVHARGCGMRMVQAVKASLAVFRSLSAWLYPSNRSKIQNLHLNLLGSRRVN